MGGRTLDVGGARSVTRYGGTARSVRRLVHPLAVERGTACSSAAAATGCPAAHRCDHHPDHLDNV